MHTLKTLYGVYGVGPVSFGDGSGTRIDNPSSTGDGHDVISPGGPSCIMHYVSCITPSGDQQPALVTRDILKSVPSMMRVP